MKYLQVELANQDKSVPIEMKRLIVSNYSDDSDTE